MLFLSSLSEMIQTGVSVKEAGYYRMQQTADIIPITNAILVQDAPTPEVLLTSVLRRAGKGRNLL